jgi:DNA-binding LacI/PurR family transcriptional regulator
MEILQNPTPPDAIIITTDEFVHGVIQAILQSGARPLLIFYRNHEIRIFNPLPAYYLEVTQRETALQLIDILVKQFEGEETERKLIHFNIVPPKENNL